MRPLPALLLLAVVLDAHSAARAGDPPSSGEAGGDSPDASQKKLLDCPAGGDGGEGGGSCKKAQQALVSILTPTRESTQHRHELLYRCFSHQTYSNKQLVVLDDSPSPSPFFSSLADPSVRYIHSKKQMNLGAKRNQLADAANGTVLVHFDDDDFYSPSYVTTMVAEMKRTKATLIKLSGWYSYSCKISFFGYWDPAETSVFGEVSDDKYKYSLFLDPRDPIVQTWVMGPSDSYDTKLRDETRYGFGFSYVYKKSLVSKIPFDEEKNFGEDLEWINRVIKAKKTKVVHFADRKGLALHLQGSWNTARIPLQYRIPDFLLGTVLHPSALNYTEPCRGGDAGPAKQQVGKGGEG